MPSHRFASLFWRHSESAFLILLCLTVAAIYFIAGANSSLGAYDYTLRIADFFLEGELGFPKRPQRHYNELVPINKHYYSVFPLGSVLTMLPIAIINKMRLLELNELTARVIAAFCVFWITFYTWKISRSYNASIFRSFNLSLFISLGTWMLCNLALAGAWQLALGFAVLGLLGCLYYTRIKTQPIIAGFFFALAFGNRTELLLIAPVFYYFLWVKNPKNIKPLVYFSIIPFCLGMATLGYNYARFNNPFDFGYARIPGVLKEPWYKHGIFSLRAIPLNAKMMLFRGWDPMDHFPYWKPYEFGGSILISSPYLMFALYSLKKINTTVIISWICIFILTFTLWIHGNPGGWQYSYRYALILLPWFLLLFLESKPQRLKFIEPVLIYLSITINIMATYLFLWSGEI